MCHCVEICPLGVCASNEMKMMDACAGRTLLSAKPPSGGEHSKLVPSIGQQALFVLHS